MTGMFGQNMIYQIATTGLYFYFQNVICLPAMALGWIMALARVWDAVNDPIMGNFVDRTHTKWGKCRPYLIFGPPVIMVIT
ncbi:MAG: MFS transporter, partial [Clostridia bacterium]|nr:MFS transporter [Clostridia bacterium]